MYVVSVKASSHLIPAAHLLALGELVSVGASNGDMDFALPLANVRALVGDILRFTVIFLDHEVGFVLLMCTYAGLEIRADGSNRVVVPV